MRRSALPAAAGLALLTLWAALSVGRMIASNLRPDGSPDGHIFWYSGHFVRQGVDPYQAFLARRAPTLPVEYLDGVVARAPVLMPGSVPAQAHTAPLVLLLTPLAYFSWPTAKLAWLAVNLALVAIVPLACARLVPGAPRALRLALVLLFPGLAAVRYAVSNGQTTLLVLALMLLAAVWSAHRPWLAGVALGLALSKYSLALPVLLLFGLERRGRAVLAAIAVQAVGVLALWGISGSTPPRVLSEYAAMMLYHTGLGEINLAARLPPGSMAAIPLGLVFSAAVAAGCAWAWRAGRRRGADPAWARLHVLSALCLWALLAVYHRNYDAAAYVVFVGMAFGGLARGETWTMTGRARRLLAAGVAILTLVMMLPAGSIVRGLLPADVGPIWVGLATRLSTLVLLASLALTLALWPRLRGARAAPT